MRIQPVYSNVYCNNNPYAKMATNGNISYKGIPTTLILLAAKEGISAVKSRQKVRYLVELEECLKSSNSEKLIAGARAITKTPDSYYDATHQGWTLWVAGKKDPDYVDSLRQRYLIQMDKISDNNHYNVQVKKDLINSLFENGHEINNDFIKQFKKLKDSVYKSFKEEIADTAFFSTRYNQKRIGNFWNERCWGFDGSLTTLPDEYRWCGKPFSLHAYRGEPEGPNTKNEICSLTIAFDNLKLASTLDKSIYGSYLNSRRERINQHKQILENYFNKVRACHSDPPPNTYNEYVTLLQTI